MMRGVFHNLTVCLRWNIKKRKIEPQMDGLTQITKELHQLSVPPSG